MLFRNNTGDIRDAFTKVSNAHSGLNSGDNARASLGVIVRAMETLPEVNRRTFRANKRGSGYARIAYGDSIAAETNYLTGTPAMDISIGRDGKVDITRHDITTTQHQRHKQRGERATTYSYGSFQEAMDKGLADFIEKNAPGRADELKRAINKIQRRQTLKSKIGLRPK